MNVRRYICSASPAGPRSRAYNLRRLPLYRRSPLTAGIRRLRCTFAVSIRGQAACDHPLRRSGPISAALQYTACRSVRTRWALALRIDQYATAAMATLQVRCINPVTIAISMAVPVYFHATSCPRARLKAKKRFGFVTVQESKNRCSSGSPARRTFSTNVELGSSLPRV